MLLDDVSGRSVSGGPARTEVPSVFAHRAEPILEAMSSPAAIVLMIGEGGSGKAYIAEIVADELRSGGSVHPVVLPHLSAALAGPAAVFGAVCPEAFGADEGGVRPQEPFEASRLADRVMEEIELQANGLEPMLILPGVDRYDNLAAALLEQLVRRRKLRVLATAHRLVGGANLLSRDPRVTRVTIGPLGLQESDTFLSQLLGVSHIAPETLHRWHAGTGGNSYALTMMLLACERSGVLRRRRGLAWVPPGLDEIPDEFSDYLDRSCSAAERATLELIALAEPMIETPLLRLLDPVATSTLMERNLIASRRHPGGQTALSIMRPVLAAAIKNRMSPMRRIELADLCFTALDADSADSGFSNSPQHLVSRVLFGLESGRRIPHDWLVQALAALSLGADPHLVLRVALALSQTFVPEDAGAASLRAVSFANLLGDAPSLEVAHRVIDRLLDDEELCEELPSALRTRLRLTQIERRFQLGTSTTELLEALSAVEAELDRGDAISREAARSTRFKLISESGDLAAAYEARFEDQISEDITIEWVRASSRSAASLILLQRGRLEEAIQIAERARSLSLIGRRPLNDTIEIQSFCWFLGYWASGSAEAAERVLEEIEANANSGHRIGAHQSGLVELGWAMIALQEARWRDAADLVELLVERFDLSDSYGIAPLLNAVHALALAALGEQDAALHALRRARFERRGFSQIVSGFRRRLVVQARQWLRIGDPGAEAMNLAAWARSQGLALIELEALHIAAFESKALAARVQIRARELASMVDPIVGDVILTHINKIASGISASDVSEPEVRLLADLGLWSPLPRVADLSAREREVALFASLGYSSKFIAERLYVSARTVETHLAHVYAKLGIADREELRRWFSADRAVEQGGHAA